MPRLNLTVGWYFNNCICRETLVSEAMYQSDVAALLLFGFDGVKLDNCGQQKDRSNLGKEGEGIHGMILSALGLGCPQQDLDKWASIINRSGRAIMIENCHWGDTVPNATWCPWNFFRQRNKVN